eukprot:591077-Prorocentrum_minimum.AAC.1
MPTDSHRFCGSPSSPSPRLTSHSACTALARVPDSSAAAPSVSHFSPWSSTSRMRSLAARPSAPSPVLGVSAMSGHGHPGRTSKGSGGSIGCSEPSISRRVRGCTGA